KIGPWWRKKPLISWEKLGVDALNNYLPASSGISGRSAEGDAHDHPQCHPNTNAKAPVHVTCPPGGIPTAERESSAAAAALRGNEHRRTRPAAAVCCSAWFGAAFSPADRRPQRRHSHRIINYRPLSWPPPQG